MLLSTMTRQALCQPARIALSAAQASAAGLLSARQMSSAAAVEKPKLNNRIMHIPVPKGLNVALVQKEKKADANSTLVMDWHGTSLGLELPAIANPHLLRHGDTTVLGVYLAPEFEYILKSKITEAFDGIRSPWKRTLKTKGVGFKFYIFSQDLIKAKLGRSHPYLFRAVNAFGNGLTFTTRRRNTLSLFSPLWHTVNHASRLIRDFRPVNRYTGKGVRYAKEVVVVRGKK